MLTIKAVAIGDPARNGIITSRAQADALGRRKYVGGLIDGLNALDTAPPTNYRLGTDYRIDYRETDANGLPAVFSNTDALVFAMSTNVVTAAETFSAQMPIVGIVSDPDIPPGENFKRYGNICGVSAKRHQKAATCLDDFLNSVTNPYFQNIVVLRFVRAPVYHPSDRAWNLVNAEASKHKAPILPVNVTAYDYNYPSAQTIAAWLSAMPQQKWQLPNCGILVLPVDLFFANAGTIIDVAQNQGWGPVGNKQKLPTFFFTTDWVGSNPATSALGAYGVPQYRCGQLMATMVNVVRTSGVPANANNRWIDAADTDFKWLTNGTVANRLGYAANTQAPPNGPDRVF